MLHTALVQMEAQQLNQTESDRIVLSTTHFLNPTNIPPEKKRGIHLTYMATMNYSHFKSQDLVEDSATFDARAVLSSKTEFA